MLRKLKEEVDQSNLDLVKHGLAIFTGGNVSGSDREKGLVIIKSFLEPGHMSSMLYATLALAITLPHIFASLGKVVKLP